MPSYPALPALLPQNSPGSDQHPSQFHSQPQPRSVLLHPPPPYPQRHQQHPYPHPFMSSSPESKPHSSPPIQQQHQTASASPRIKSDTTSPTPTPFPPASHSNSPKSGPPHAAASVTAPPAPTSSPPMSSHAHGVASGHACLWENCTHHAADPEMLYIHLCNDHIGRKSTGNLCLTCKWRDCGVSCAKRDHITSHLRVHTPLKPHTCEICQKAFKRPQDLKKHEKIHTAEHHSQHKHSKAQLAFGSSLLPPGTGASHGLSPQPSISRSSESSGTPPSAQDRMPSVRRSPHSLEPQQQQQQQQQQQPYTLSLSLSPPLLAYTPSYPSSYLPLPSAPAHSQSPSLSPHSPGLLTPALDSYALAVAATGYAVSPAHMPHTPGLGMHRAHSSGTVPTSASANGLSSLHLDSSGGEASNKRSVDGLEDFFTEAKRRRYANQAYDEAMAQRLSELAPAYLHPPQLQHPHQQQQQQMPVQYAMPAIHSPAELAQINTFLVQLGKEISAPPVAAYDGGGAADRGGGADAFSDQELAALGLAGMPGIGFSTDAYDGGYGQQQQQQYAPMQQQQQQYASLRHHQLQQQQHQQQHQQQQQQHQQQHQQHHHHAPSHVQNHSPPQLSYAYVPQLDASSMGGGVRTATIARLKDAPPSPSRSAMIRAGDPALKLPALERGGSGSGRGLSLPPLHSLVISSPPPTSPTSPSSATRVYPRLPPLSALLASPPPTPVRRERERESGMGKEREEHAAVVRELLVRVNREWVRRFGRGGAEGWSGWTGRKGRAEEEEEGEGEEESREGSDVEMASA